MTALLYNHPGSPLVVLDFDAYISETHMCSAAVSEHPQETGAAATDGAVPNNPKVTIEVLVSNSPIGPSNQWTEGFRMFPWVGDWLPVELISQVDDVTVQGVNRRMAAAASVKGGETGITVKTTTNSGGTVSSSTRELRGLSDLLPRTPFSKTNIKPISTTPAKFVTTPAPRTARWQQFNTQDRVALVYSELRRLIDESIEVRLVTKMVTYPRMLIENLRAPQNQPNDSITFTMDLVAVKTALVSITTVTKKAAPAIKAVEPEQDQGDQPTDFGLGLTDEETLKDDYLRIGDALSGR